MDITETKNASVAKVKEEAAFFTRHLWITATGLMIAFGYAILFIVAPFNEGINKVDKQHLYHSLLILLIVTCSRDILIEGVKRIKKLVIKNSDDEFLDDKLPRKKAIKRWWIPFVGWALACGYCINCCICPFVDSVQPIDWNTLEMVLLAMLVITGGKDIFFSGLKITFAIGKFANKTASTEDNDDETQQN